MPDSLLLDPLIFWVTMILGTLSILLAFFDQR
jgi:hypothetical protein